MKTPRLKRSLHIALFSVLALIVLAGAYLIFNYPSALPRLHHEALATASRDDAHTLPDVAAQPLAAQAPQATDEANTGQAAASTSSPSQTPAARHASTPHLVASTTQSGLQPSSRLIDNAGPYRVLTQVRHAAEDLVGYNY